MRRRAVVAAALPALAVAAAWLRQEEGALVGEALLVTALALAPAGLRSLPARLAAALAAALATVWVGFGVVPWALVPSVDEPWLAPLRARFTRGLADYYEVSLPFDPVERPEMHGVLLLALLAGVLAVGALVAARRPALAALALAGATGWPATPVDGRGALLLGAFVLAAALWLLVLAEPRGRGAAVPALVAAVALVGVATVASGSDGVVREAALDWRSWDPYDAAGGRVGVAYVWDANYGGIRFPERATTVLRIQAPKRSLYWRATTLDLFTADRWLENAYPTENGPADGRLPPDPLQPDAAADRAGWIRQDVEVEGLRDDHLVAAATPQAVESSSLPELVYLATGLMRTQGGLQRGQRYTVWSWAPRPAPDELLASPATYPRETARFLELEGTALPAFGRAGRRAEVAGVFTDDRSPALWPYRPLWNAALRVTAGTTSPYGATLAVERWLRARGGFRYEEQPTAPVGLPPLADFVVRGRAGYCQHFAGTMAVMLRMLGIPARVAVGFTSGSWADGTWTVTDRDAHAWVEAWFAGYGWLPFDPTPGRGTLGATYTIASDSAEAAQILNGARLPNLAEDLLTPARVGDAAVPVAVPPSERRTWPIVVAALLLAGTVALGVVKDARRRLRYRDADPRRVAAATHAELRDWLRDQGIDPPVGGGVRELAAVAERQLGVSARAWAAAATLARYGPPAAAAPAAPRARRELRELLRAARAHRGGRHRLRGYFALRSLRRGGAAV